MISIVYLTHKNWLDWTDDVKSQLEEHCHLRAIILPFATMRYTISGIPKATVSIHLLCRVEHYVSGLLQLAEF